MASEGQIEQVSNLLDGIRLNNHDQPFGGNPALEQTCKELIENAEQVIEKARRVQAIIKQSQPGSVCVAAVSSLGGTCNDLAATAQVSSHSLTQSIVDYILSRGHSNPVVMKLLLHFRSRLETLVQDVITQNPNDAAVFLTILGKCYSESVCVSGELSSEYYFVQLDETALESPYDPDFESDRYYEHENRLIVDESYAEMHRERQERERDARLRQRERENITWIRFWWHELAQLPDGPTLFCPLIPGCLTDKLSDCPKYLFRVFDGNSSGLSNGSIVASEASTYERPGSSKVDLLSMAGQQAIDMLLKHLDRKSLRWAPYSNNLMSWSSSLLFTIQYAIYRCHRLESSPRHVYILTLDTTQFAYGQFARDLWLLRTCQNERDYNDATRRFLILRKVYDNGEYLSQGRVYHKDRSCVCSLQQLIDAGLHRLYPEFDEAGGKSKWTKRVEELRSQWSSPQTTTPDEVRTAVRMANQCFRSFPSDDMALALLTFKNRPIPGDDMIDSQARSKDREDLEPTEVARFYTLLDRFQSLNRVYSGGGASGLSSIFRRSRLEEFFGCDDNA